MSSKTSATRRSPDSRRSTRSTLSCRARCSSWGGYALALTTEGAALGIIHQKIWAPVSGRVKNERRLLPIEQKESFKWIEALRTVSEGWKEQNPRKEQTLILIADREADFFEHYAQPRHDGVALLVRVKQMQRRICHNNTSVKIIELLPKLTPLCCGLVKVWRRKSQKARMARVSYSFAAVQIPPTYKQTLPGQHMNLVYVKEEGRSGQDAIEWALLTTLPVESAQDAVTVAGYYSRRWVIARFHLILKSGLNIEKLQIDTFTRLRNALQLYALIGWHLLWLYRLGRSAPDELAELYFDRDAIEVLSTVSRRSIRVMKDFLMQVGRLGGFMPSRKQPLPGEKTLWIGLRHLIAAAQGFNAAKLKYGTG